MTVAEKIDGFLGNLVVMSKEWEKRAEQHGWQEEYERGVAQGYAEALEDLRQVLIVSFPRKEE